MTVRDIALSAAVAIPTVLAGAPDPERRPLIGINMDARARTDRGVNYSLSGGYVDAVRAAGGIPIAIPALETLEDVAYYAELVDGFVLVGGSDINPARFGQEKHESVQFVHTRREEFDFALLEAALETRKPVLAICLGMQELNVIHGGDLIQDIPSMVQTDVAHRASTEAPYGEHTITITPGTLLHRLIGEESITVNSIHHQAVGNLGKGLVASAAAPDGIVEAIELKDHPFALGLQWHPEIMYPDPVQFRLFQGFVKAAKEQSGATLLNQ